MKKKNPAPSIRQLEEAVTAARLRGGGTFTLDDVRSLLPPGGEDPSERLETLLESDTDYFSDGTGTYTGRAEFFTGGEFLITPDDREIEEGILFPGHRFTAFVSPEVFPSEVTLIAAETQTKCRHRSVSGKLADFFHYHILLGSDQVFDYFVAEHPENEALRHAPGADCPVRLSVFDLKKFYRETGFSGGDALLCRVEDWQRGIVSFRHLSGDIRRGADRTAWIEAATAALLEVIDRFDDYLDIPEQLAWAFFHGGKSLLTAPQGSLDELVRETDTIEIGLDGGCAHLIRRRREEEPEPEPEPEHEHEHDHEHDRGCDCGCEEEEEHDLPDGFGISRGETGDFARLLRDIGLSQTPAEIDAYILDNCFHRELEYQDFYDRCFGRDRLDFADEAQEAVFRNFVEDRWEQITGNYDRVPDEIKAPVRSAVLEIVDERIDFFNALKQSGVDPAKLPEEEFRKIATTGVYLDHLLRLLNAPSEELSEAEAEEMSEKLAEIAETQTAAIERLQPLIL